MNKKRTRKSQRFMAGMLLWCLIISPLVSIGIGAQPSQAADSSPASLGQYLFDNQWDSLLENSEQITTITQNTTWKKADNILIDGAIVIDGGATLTIEKGTIIKFSRREGKERPFLALRNGSLQARGSEQEKIVFTSDQADSAFSLFLNNESDQSSFFRYVEISKAGGAYQLATGPVFQVNFWQKIVNVARAEEETVSKTSFPVIYEKGKVHFENTQWMDNYLADVFVANLEVQPENPEQNYLEIVNSNFENNHDRVALISNSAAGCGYRPNPQPCVDQLVLKNNYYDSTLGPVEAYEDYDSYLENQLDYAGDFIFKGQLLVGAFFQLQGFREHDLIADPAIIIPGIMGSWQNAEGNWELDPILHSYDDQAKAFKSNGYERDVNLFEFPYQWRQSNVHSAIQLKDKINQIQQNTQVSVVDLVAHSMGGLVARQYIESGDYQNNVDQLVTLGTPHRGAPKSYLMWENAEGFSKEEEFLLLRHFSQEAKHAGYSEVPKYIRAEIPSLGELLPDYDYLYDANLKQMRAYPERYPENDFLENLNKSSQLEKLNKVRVTNIIGNLEEERTITKIRVEEESPNIWEHGQPENYYEEGSDQGLEYGQGDETVPKSSAEFISAHKKN